MNPINSQEFVTNGLPSQTQDRVVHWYDVPRSLAEQTNTVKVGLVELTLNEEEMAAKRVSGTSQVEMMLSLTLNMLRESLRYVCVRRTADDGKVSTVTSTLSAADGSADQWWTQEGAHFHKLRGLVQQAHAKIHNPEADEVTSFFKSHTTTVG